MDAVDGRPVAADSLRWVGLTAAGVYAVGPGFVNDNDVKEKSARR